MEQFSKAFYELPHTEPGFSVRVGEMKGSQSYLYHWHDAVEILYGLEKTTSVGIEGCSYTLCEGDIVIIGSGENHCIFPSDHQARRLAILFEPSQIFSGQHFSPYQDCFSQISRHSSAWQPEPRQMLKDGIAGIYDECGRQQPGWELQVYSLLAAMAAAAVRSLPKEEVKPRHREDDMLRSVLAYLSAEYLNDITLTSCAQALGFHPAYLSHQFMKQLGVSFHRYLVNLRLMKAESLLEDPDIPVGQAALQAGFTNEKTFYRVFRVKHGMPPGQYRKMRDNKAI